MLTGRHVRIAALCVVLAISIGNGFASLDSPWRLTLHLVVSALIASVLWHVAFAEPKRTKGP